MIKFSDLFLAPPDPNDPYNLSQDNVIGRYTRLTRDWIARMVPDMRYKTASDTAEIGTGAYTFDDFISFYGRVGKSTRVDKFDQTVYALVCRRGIRTHMFDNGPFAVDLMHGVIETDGVNPRYAEQRLMVACMHMWTYDCVPSLALECDVPMSGNICDDIYLWTHDCDLELESYPIVVNGEVEFENKPLMKKHDSYRLVRKMYALMRARLCVYLRRLVHPDIARKIVCEVYAW